MTDAALLSRRWSRKQAGFTLLEILVVMALLSVLMLAMVSALRGVGQGGDRVEARLQQLDDERLAAGFLRNALGRISARSVTTPRGTGPLFEGAPDHVAWVGVMPARYGAGGRHFFRLAVEDIDGNSALVLRYLPWVDQPGFPDWSGAPYQVVVPGVQALGLRYEDARQPDPAQAWSEAWAIADDLPARIALLMQGERLSMDRMVVPLRVLPASDPRYGGDETVIGGGKI